MLSCKVLLLNSAVSTVRDAWPVTSVGNSDKVWKDADPSLLYRLESRRGY